MEGLAIKKIAGLVTSALGTIGVINKVDNAGDTAKALDKLADAGYTGKIADDAIDTAREMATHVDECGGVQNVEKQIQRLGWRSKAANNGAKFELDELAKAARNGLTSIQMHRRK